MQVILLKALIHSEKALNSLWSLKLCKGKETEKEIYLMTYSALFSLFFSLCFV